MSLSPPRTGHCPTPCCSLSSTSGPCGRSRCAHARHCTRRSLRAPLHLAYPLGPNQPHIPWPPARRPHPHHDLECTWAWTENQDVLIECINSNLIKGRLDQSAAAIDVVYCAGIGGSCTMTLSFDLCASPTAHAPYTTNPTRAPQCVVVQTASLSRAARSHSSQAHSRIDSFTFFSHIDIG